MTFIKGMTPWNKDLKNWMPLESKLRMICLKIGKTAWNKGKKGLQVAWNKGKHPEYVQGKNHPMYGKHHTLETKEKMRNANLGIKRSEEYKNKLSLVRKEQWRTGKLKGGWKLSEETKKKMSRPKPWMKGRIAVSGEKCWNWKGGVSKYVKERKYSPEHNEWRKIIFVRDNFICQDCGINKTYFEAHHIKSWKDFPGLRFDINNGMTLCLKCHKKRHSKRDKKVEVSNS
jgi:hypothetical protein